MKVDLNGLIKRWNQGTKDEIHDCRSLAYRCKLRVFSADGICRILRNQCSSCLNGISLNAVHNFLNGKIRIFCDSSFHNICQKILSGKQTFYGLVFPLSSDTGIYLLASLNLLCSPSISSYFLYSEIPELMCIVYFLVKCVKCTNNYIFSCRILCIGNMQERSG